MKQSNMSILLRLCAFVVAFLMVGGDLVGLAQNSNSSTTGDTAAQNTNTNMGTHRRTRHRGRRGTRHRSMNTNMAGNTNEMTTGEPAAQNTNDNTGAAPMATMGHRRRGRRRHGAATMPADTTGAPADTTGMMQTGAASTLGRVGDPASLDGTYTGTINYPGGNMTGDATLTITGNTFTLESGGQTTTGTLTSQSFPGQTAVSMRFGTDSPAKIISLRAKKTGNGIWLANTSGESQVFSFRGTGDATGGLLRHLRRRHP